MSENFYLHIFTNHQQPCRFLQLFNASRIYVGKFLNENEKRRRKTFSTFSRSFGDADFRGSSRIVGVLAHAMFLGDGLSGVTVGRNAQEERRKTHLMAGRGEASRRAEGIPRPKGTANLGYPPNEVSREAGSTRGATLPASAKEMASSLSPDAGMRRPPKTAPREVLPFRLKRLVFFAHSRSPPRRLVCRVKCIVISPSSCPIPTKLTALKLSVLA